MSKLSYHLFLDPFSLQDLLSPFSFASSESSVTHLSVLLVILQNQDLPRFATHISLRTQSKLNLNDRHWSATDGNARLESQVL